MASLVRPRMVPALPVSSFQRVAGEIFILTEASRMVRCREMRVVRSFLPI